MCIGDSALKEQGVAGGIDQKLLKIRKDNTEISAGVAQLMERQTRNLEVPGLSPGIGSI